MRFPNRSVLDDALRQCRSVLIVVTRERLAAAFPNSASERLHRVLPKLQMRLRGAAQTASAGVVRHEFADDFELLDFPEIRTLLGSYPVEVYGSKVPPIVLVLLDELAESRNANAHSPPSDISERDRDFGLSRVARVLRAFGLPTDSIDALAQPLADSRVGVPSAIWEWSEFGSPLSAREIDLLDERIWPRHDTPLLASGLRLCPYVARDADGDLRRRVRSASTENARRWHDRIIVLVGESKSGKTRLLVECLKESVLDQRHVLWLRQPTAAESCPLARATGVVRRHPELGPALVVVIDDLQFHIGAQRESIAYHDVRYLAESGTIVAFTTHPHVLKGLGSELPTTDDPAGRPTAEAALDQRLREVLESRRIDIAPAFSSEEVARGEVTGLPVEQISRLPETLAATNLVRDKVEAADPHQRALIESARLLTISAPNGIVAGSVLDLTALWCELEYGRTPSEGHVQAALTWATRPVVGDIALLQPVDLGGDGKGGVRYRLLDQLREPVRFPQWLPEVTSALTLPDLVAIAAAWAGKGDSLAADLMLADAELMAETPNEIAYLRWVICRDAELGDAHLRRAASAGHADAMFDLAAELSTSGGSLDEIRYWFESAATAGAEDALLEFADVLLERGLTADAVAILREEAERRTTAAYMPLAQLLERAGDQSGALYWFTLAREAGDPAFADLYEQGKFAEQLGDGDAATSLFHQGMERGDAWCAYALAETELRHNRFNDASRRLLDAAASGGHPFAAIRLAEAELNLNWTVEGVRVLLAALRAAEESEELYDYLMSGQPDHRLAQARIRLEEALATEMVAVSLTWGLFWKRISRMMRGTRRSTTRPWMSKNTRTGTGMVSVEFGCLKIQMRTANATRTGDEACANDGVAYDLGLAGGALDPAADAGRTARLVPPNEGRRCTERACPRVSRTVTR
jgi:hypothetical protein